MGTVIHPSPRPAEDFEAVYRRCFAFVWRSVVRLGVPVADVDDAVQEVFVVAFRRRRDFDGRASVEAWLYGISRHVARNRRRRIARRTQLWLTFGERARSVDGEQQLEQCAAAEHLHQFLESLTSSQRDAFILGELEQMTGREMGDALGVSPNTAAARLRAARKAFTQYCEQLQQDVPLDGDQAEAPSDALERHWGVLVLAIPSLVGRGVAGEGVAGSAAGLEAGGGSSLATTGSSLVLVKSFGVTLAVGGTALMLAGVSLGGHERLLSNPTSATDPTLATSAGRGRAEPVVRQTASASSVLSDDAVAVAPASPLTSGGSASEQVLRPTPSTDVDRMRAGTVATAGSSLRRPGNETGAQAGHGQQRTLGSRAKAEDTLAAEAALLAEIRAAQGRGHHEAALELATAHARRFRSDGQLSAARQRAQIISLCALGRVDEAETIASTPDPCR